MDNGASKPVLPGLFCLFTIEKTTLISNRRIHNLNLIIVFQLITKYF